MLESKNNVREYLRRLLKSLSMVHPWEEINQHDFEEIQKKNHELLRRVQVVVEHFENAVQVDHLTDSCLMILFFRSFFKRLTDVQCFR